MCGIQNDQTTFLGNLADTWKGSGGASFRDAIKEIASETEMGTFVIKSITQRTTFAKNYFNGMDAKLAADIEKTLESNSSKQKK